jgi:hypothetical protein
MWAMHPLIERIEELFIPDLERLASHMRQQFPALRFNVWHGPTGTLTDSQGYDVGLECLFPQAAKDAPNSLALSVDVCYLTSIPRLMADVVWGHSFWRFRSCV